MYKEIDYLKFMRHLEELKRNKAITIFFDIETFQYNELEGKEKPTKYKNCVYSVAISYFHKKDLYIVLFPNFKEFIDSVVNVYKDVKNPPRIELIAHNTNKYDNHFLRNDLIYYYNLPFTNQFLNNSIEEGNLYSYKLKELTPKDREGIILEKRVKSRNNLELTFFIKGIQFFTTDNYIKTHSSIKSLGERLERLGYLTDEELKTDFNYTKYNKDEDMREDIARLYALQIFYNLSDDELKYIRNDVIILAYSVKYYSKIFKGFDYSKITFTRNILDSYNKDDLVSYQLLHQVGQGRHKISVEYTDYEFDNENFYDYLKPFYNGGLNFYNSKYLGKIIDEEVFGIDINSSYPTVMYKENIPTFINSYESFPDDKVISIKEIEEEENTYTLYRIRREIFDDFIICKIQSTLLKQMLVKYYNKHDYININSYTFKMIENITGLEIDKLPVKSYVKWDCIPFGARDVLADYYRIKTQGQNKYKMNMNDLFNIYPTDELSDYVYTDEEIDISKLNLNGLYGIPALRPYFNLFRWQGHNIVNVENGFMNSQRNIVFSIFVTSVSVYNLLNPLKYLSQEEIDENFLYCDTDSLYFKSKIRDKIPVSIYDPNNLGFWDIQNDKIEKFFVMNHKKYCYLENGKITVKAGGVPQESFDTSLDFDEFIEKQFTEGVRLKSNRSIFNEQGTISIYPAYIDLEFGKDYPLYSYNPDYIEQKEKLFKLVREELKGEEDLGLYVESNIGTFSIAEVYPIEHSNQRQDLTYYELKENYIKNNLLNIRL